LRDCRGSPKEERIEKQLLRKRELLRKKELSKAMKEDNKEVALGTSKINYMDPRVTVAWCKKMQVPIEKVFNKSLLDKFPWAMQATTEYIF
jgi:DNA topoisomerase-1